MLTLKVCGKLRRFSPRFLLKGPSSIMIAFSDEKVHD